MLDAMNLQGNMWVEVQKYESDGTWNDCGIQTSESEVHGNEQAN